MDCRVFLKEDVTNHTAHLEIGKLKWTPEAWTNTAFRWEIRTQDGAEPEEWTVTEGNFADNPTNASWATNSSTDPERDFRVRAWFDCDADDETCADDEPRRTLYPTVVLFDLDIDGDHTSDYGGPEESDFEEALEEENPGSAPHQAHKYIVVNEYHENDTNGIPGYADGHNLDETENTADDATSEPIAPTNVNVFVPIRLTLEAGDDPPTEATVRFTYSQGTVAVGEEDDEKTYTPDGEHLRIWTRNQFERRINESVTAGGHLVPTGEDIPLDDLNLPGTIDLYVEGLQPSEELADQTIEVEADGFGDATFEDIVRLTVIRVDVDIDSDNNNGTNAPARSQVEDHIEDIASCTNRPGKIIGVNDGDKDGDGLVDFADGYDGLQAVFGVSTNVDDVNTNEVFIPVVFELPEPIKLEWARVRLDYDASDPLGLTTNAAGRHLPAPGHLRLWRKSGASERDGHAVLDTHEPGDYLEPGEYSAAEFGFRTGMRTVTNYLEAVRASATVADQRILFACQPDGTNRTPPTFIVADAVRVTVLKVDLIPDWDRDRDIDDDDENQASTSNPLRFWINDDADFFNAADSGNDVPAQAGFDANWKPAGGPGTEIVDGVRDFEDFFAVHVDLKAALDLLGTTDYRYFLKHADSAVNALIDGELTPEASGTYLTDHVWCEVHYHDWLEQIEATGFELPADFFNGIIAGTEGVILVEGRQATEKPLVLEVRKASDDSLICSTELPLKVSGVEDMYRWINLRNVTGGSEARATDTNEPLNYPDSLSNGKQFVFVHGFNNDEQAARATIAEVFKRLYQSGSQAMFTGLVWQGDETPGVLPAGAYYHADVINAFQTASAVASSVEGLPGQKYVAAHSLGNMVVSSAIVDHGLNPARYFMIDAAVAMEAYVPTYQYPQEIAISPWLTYTNRVWASEWYRLFGATDGRNGLTWRDRFGDISQAINYYSSGEDVLDNNASGGSVSLFDAPQYAWVFQEQIKGGVLPAILVGVDSHGGWKFNNDYSAGVYDPSNGVNVTATTPAEAAAVPPYLLRTDSFFKRFYDDNLYGTSGGTLATDDDVRVKILAEAIPSTSRAAGRNELAGFGVGLNGNEDMMNMKTGWPRTDDSWLHSDFKNVGFPYVHLFYEDVVSKGGL